MERACPGGHTSVMSTVHVHDDVMVSVADRNCLATAWYNAPRPGHFKELLRQVRRMHREHGAPILHLNVILRGVPRFEDAVRQEGLELVRETEHIRGYTAHVIELGGLAGAATRMFVSTLGLMSSRRGSVRVFAEPVVACTWLAHLELDASTPLALKQLYGALRAIEPRRIAA
jgi:hypothetical protein